MLHLEYEVVKHNSGIDKEIIVEVLIHIRPPAKTIT